MIMNIGHVMLWLLCVVKGLLRHAEESVENYQENKDRDLITSDPGYTVEASEMIFKAGQSKRIWNEVYKVLVILC